MIFGEGYSEGPAPRLPGGDPAWPGRYFVTICTAGRQGLFADPALRQLAAGAWATVGRTRPGAQLEAWGILPDQVHAIVAIPDRGAHEEEAGGVAGPAALGAPAGALGALVRGYKSLVAAQVNQLRRTPAAPVWQRSYYELRLDDQAQLEAARRYIAGGPSR